MWLDVESHTVRLLRGSSDDGMMNGNIEKPAVRITPVIIRPVQKNAVFSCFEPASSNAIRPPAIATTGAAIIHGNSP